MLYVVSMRTVSVRFDDDRPVVTGHTSSLRERTVHAVSGEITFHEDGDVRAEFLGPYERSSASLSTVYASVKVDVDGSSPLRHPDAPQWVLDIIEEVRPA